MNIHIEKLETGYLVRGKVYQGNGVTLAAFTTLADLIAWLPEHFSDEVEPASEPDPDAEIDKDFRGYIDRVGRYIDTVGRAPNPILEDLPFVTTNEPLDPAMFKAKGTIPEKSPLTAAVKPKRTFEDPGAPMGKSRAEFLSDLDEKHEEAKQEIEKPNAWRVALREKKKAERQDRIAAKNGRPAEAPNDPFLHAPKHAGKVLNHLCGVADRSKQTDFQLSRRNITLATKAPRGSMPAIEGWLKDQGYINVKYRDEKSDPIFHVFAKAMELHATQ